MDINTVVHIKEIMDILIEILGEHTGSFIRLFLPYHIYNLINGRVKKK